MNIMVHLVYTMSLMHSLLQTSLRDLDDTSCKYHHILIDNFLVEVLIVFLWAVLLVSSCICVCVRSILYCTQDCNVSV